ncbi:hypothetical protein B0J11DRAFT_607592 [Dendryphion nanum]|uniref:Exonuclease domain-containing protein n=1 Tax=Dendryphion nanum TaxID=256645 RepID=A0A9P9DMP8_9PLEO|nr:hypothetical protein B0J11DRAFT_607592 [Dendryphion nanum]
MDSMLTEYLAMKKKEGKIQDPKQDEVRVTCGKEDRVTASAESELLHKKRGDKDAVFVRTANEDPHKDQNGAAGKAKKPRQNGAGQFSLKTLTKKRFGRDIQISGKLGHDSLEDATAARDLVHWIVADPEEVQ